MLTATGTPSVVLLPDHAATSQLPTKKDIRLEAGRYVARLALRDQERDAAYRLRFRVFNLEMHEGLESAYVDGYDKDHFDEVCDHLIVEDKVSGEIVGTYRLQMGDVARRYFGYYSEQEFCFTPYEGMRDEIVELGRACIQREHRSPEVLHLLWRGIARYALANGGRYMMGCCSLTSQDADMGWAVYESLQGWMVEPELRTTVTPAFALPPVTVKMADVRAPKLLRAYLTIGAKICGEPAIDREFKTIDFLTLMDLQTLHPRMAARFLEDIKLNRLRQVSRSVKLLAVLLALALDCAIRRPRAGVKAAVWTHEWCRRIVKALGVECDVSGRLPEGGAVVSNHLSYLDILVYGSVRPFVMVAKSEVKSWPLLGWITARAGTVYVQRGGGPSTYGAVNAAMAAAYRTGLPVLFFPEGTTTNGLSGVLPFRRGLFHSVLNEGVSLQAAAVRYELETHSANGDASVAQDVCWWGDAYLGPHLFRLLGLCGVKASVQFGDEVLARADRFVLSESARAAVVGMCESSFSDAVLTEEESVLVA